MIITKDNLLRFVREKKYVTPTIISENFETSTMIASAALSELSKDKLVAISNIKIGATPYYYDPKQKDCLIELGKKHLSSYEKEVFLKIQEQQIINDASLSIQHRLAIEKIKDFALPLEMTIQGKEIKFWVWYLRDIHETKKQINDALSGNTKTQEESKKKSTPNKNTEEKRKPENKPVKKIIQEQTTQALSFPEEETLEKGEPLIEKYFKEHYLNLETKNKENKTIKYEASLRVKNMVIYFDAIYYLKKTNESEILKFYTSSQKPKIIFMENPSKKIMKLSDELSNLEVINV